MIRSKGSGMVTVGLLFLRIEGFCYLLVPAARRKGVPLLLIYLCQRVSVWLRTLIMLRSEIGRGGAIAAIQ